MLCNSWIIVDRSTGKPVFETFEQRTALYFRANENRLKYETLTAHEWLVRFNSQHKA